MKMFVPEKKERKAVVAEMLTELENTGSICICEKKIVFKTTKRRKFDDLGVKFDSPNRAKAFLGSIFEQEPYEKLYAVTVNSANEFVGMICLAEGTVNKAFAYPRKLVTFLLIETNATGVILAHNHPGGGLRASPEDIDITKKFIGILEPLDVSVLDHLIYGEGEWLSMREEGLF